MPYEHTHTARQMPPSKCDKIRTQEITAGIAFLYCVKGGKADVESVHFDAAKFSAEEARAWLKKHDFKTDEFVPAKPAHAKAGAVPDVTCQMVDAAKCPMGDKCPMHDAPPATAGLGAADIAALAGPVEIRAAAGGACDLEAQAGADALPRVNMLAYTGVPMKLDGFHLPVVVDLESLKVPRQKVPILRGHDGERVAGHSDRIDVTAQRLKASGVLSGTPEHTADVTHTARNGFPWQVSLGAQTTKKVEHVPAGESAKVNGRVWPGPLLVARGAVLRELSLLPMGADGNTDAGFSAGAVTDVGAADTQGG